MRASKPVCNDPKSSQESVAQAALGATICAERNFFQYNVEMQGGKWNKTAQGSRELHSIGLVGCGTIGSRVAEMGHGCGFKVYYTDIRGPRPEMEGIAEFVETREELYKLTRVITLHTWGGQENYDLIDADDIAMMQPETTLVNFARGCLVNEQALVDGHEAGQIHRYHGDVFKQEKKNGQPFKSILAGRSWTSLSPHVGGSTEDNWKRIAEFMAGEVILTVRFGNLNTVRNLPPREQVPFDLAEGGPRTRIFYAHHNRAGAANQLIGPLAEAGFNKLYDRTEPGEGDIATCVVDFEVVRDDPRFLEIIQRVHESDDCIDIRICA